MSDNPATKKLSWSSEPAYLKQGNLVNLFFLFTKRVFLITYRHRFKYILFIVFVLLMKSNAFF